MFKAGTHLARFRSISDNLPNHILANLFIISLVIELSPFLYFSHPFKATDKTASSQLIIKQTRISIAINFQFYFAWSAELNLTECDSFSLSQFKQMKL